MTTWTAVLKRQSSADMSVERGEFRNGTRQNDAKSRHDDTWQQYKQVIMLTSRVRRCLLCRPMAAAVCTLALALLATVKGDSLRHLVIVAGHGVHECSERNLPSDRDACWVIDAWQQGDAPSYIAHVAAGVEIASADPSALLVFSGGQTRAAAGPRSEAASYVSLAMRENMLPSASLPWSRVATEEYARDSLENLTFSLCRFYEVAGHMPERVTVVSFPHKERRYSELHRVVAGIPAENFAYRGVDVIPRDAPPTDIALEPFLRDAHGCTAELQAKRALRDPFRRTTPSGDSCPPMRAILRACDAH